ncbi:MAG TPA: M6 family metalloprotease domain-containing protein [Candidatus Eisenbacteria bacterium]
MAALSGALLSAPASATMPTPSGHVPAPVAEAFERGLFALPEPPVGLGTSAVQSFWRLPILLVCFADENLTYGAADFDSALFGSRSAIPTGSVSEYYQWASRGRITVVGEVVATVRLPYTLAYYGDQSWGLSTSRTPNNLYGAVRTALDSCQRDVDWSRFDQDHDGYVDMLWFLHSGIGGEASLLDRNRMWSITSRMSGGWGNGGVYVTSQVVPGSTTQRYRVDRFSSVPELSGLIPGRRSEIGVFCHEFGHALGLPDLYDTSSLSDVVNVGPGNWSLMSTGAYGGNGLQPEYPSHPGGWASVLLGWNETVRPAVDGALDIAPLVHGSPVVEFWFQGQPYPEHFLLENRRQEGFDRSLRGSGLVITHVDEAVIGQRLAANRVNSGPTPGLVLVEADGDSDLILGHDRGTGSDPFPGESLRTRFDDETRPSARTFKNLVTNTALSGITQVGENIHLDMQVRAPGWLPAQDHTDPEFQPLGEASSGSLALTEPDGSVDVVSCEFRAGHPQVVLHRGVGGIWGPPEELSSSPTAALTPTIALTPGGNLAVAWSDSRGGRSRIWGRVRMQGRWSPEAVLVEAPGENRYPAIGADGHGRVYLAWLSVQGGVPRVYFTRFVYFAPFGQPIPVTAAGRLPGSPTVAVDQEGVAYIMWPDAADNPQRLWFSRFQPDSGMTPNAPLTLATGAETAVNALVDAAGTLHLAWVVGVSGATEIHYQRRYKSRRPSPRDSSVVSSGAPLGSPSLAVDPSGVTHLGYVLIGENGQQVLYKRWRPVEGWDFMGTEVSSAAEGTASAPLVMPTSPGNVTVLYFAYGAAGPRFMSRSRALDGVPQAIPARGAAQPLVALAIRPNPLRAGQELDLEWSARAPRPEGGVELFDLSGRRVASATLERGADRWWARFSPALTSRLASGVYFARARGSAAARIVVLR